MSKVTTALVIGGGVAGPVTAMALSRAGIDAAVYEAYPTTADGVGGSLAIAPNGLAALRIIGAEDTVLAIARPISRMVMAVGTKRFLEQPGLPGLPPLQVLGSLRIMPRLPHWHRGRMVLVGDAAHAPSNSSGQGASLAIESAVQLARCLRDLPDAPSAFAAYERLRRARVEKIAAGAAMANRTKAPGPVARMLMPLLMPIVMKTVMAPEKALAPVQRYEIDWGEPVMAVR